MLQFYANKSIWDFYTDLCLIFELWDSTLIQILLQTYKLYSRRCIDTKRYIINLCDVWKAFAAFRHPLQQTTYLSRSVYSYLISFKSSYLYIANYDLIPSSKWNATLMQVSEDEFSLFDEYLTIWMTTSSTTIFSDYLSYSSKYIEIFFAKWIGSNFWGTSTEIQNYLNDLTVFFVTLNSYYDENDTSYF